LAGVLQRLFNPLLTHSWQSSRLLDCSADGTTERDHKTMFGHATRVLGAVALLAGLSLIPATDLGAANHFAHMGTVRIGMIATLFSDVPQPIVMAMMQPFAALMESQTGVNGELVACGDADNLGQQLTDDKGQLGGVHGIELAWAP